MDTEAVAELLRSELAAADALLEIFAAQHADPTQQAHILDHIRYDASSRSCEDDACTQTDRIHPPSLGQLRTAPHRISLLLPRPLGWVRVQVACLARGPPVRGGVP